MCHYNRINRAQLIGSIVDIWCPEGVILVEDSVIRTTIKTITARAGLVVNRPLAVWAATRRIWCLAPISCASGDVMTESFLALEPDFKSAELFPSRAIKINLVNDALAILYPKNTRTPIDPGRFLLRQGAVYFKK
jgi:hypothetical protein